MSTHWADMLVGFAVGSVCYWMGYFMGRYSERRDMAKKESK